MTRITADSVVLSPLKANSNIAHIFLIPYTPFFGWLELFVNPLTHNWHICPEFQQKWMTKPFFFQLEVYYVYPG